MTPEEHLLLKLAEECGEVGKEVSKALLFGWGDRITYEPAGPRGVEGKTCGEKIVEELNDLMGVIESLVRVGILPEDWQNPAKQASRPLRLARFMVYAARMKACDRPAVEWLERLTGLRALSPRPKNQPRPVGEADACSKCKHLHRPEPREVWAECRLDFPGLFYRGACRVCPHLSVAGDPD